MAEKDDEEQMARKAAARTMGRAKTPKKAVAARQNGQKGGRPPMDLSSIPCECAGGTEDYETHDKGCQRGKVLYMRHWRAMKRQEKEAQDANS